MTTAVDTSILLDVLADDPVRGPAAVRSLKDARSEGRLVVSPVVWAEVRAFFPDDRSMRDAFEDAGLEFSPIDRRGADLGGNLWRAYRHRGGRRERVLADFLIAAHAMTAADRLLTRDRGFGRGYFEGLEVVSPGR